MCTFQQFWLFVSIEYWSTSDLPIKPKPGHSCMAWAPQSNWKTGKGLPRQWCNKRFGWYTKQILFKILIFFEPRPNGAPRPHWRTRCRPASAAEQQKREWEHEAPLRRPVASMINTTHSHRPSMICRRLSAYLSYQDANRQTNNQTMHKLNQNLGDISLG